MFESLIINTDCIVSISSVGLNESLIKYKGGTLEYVNLPFTVIKQKLIN